MPSVSPFFLSSCWNAEDMEVAGADTQDQEMNNTVRTVNPRKGPASLITGATIQPASPTCIFTWTAHSSLCMPVTLRRNPMRSEGCSRAASVMFHWLYLTHRNSSLCLIWSLLIVRVLQPRHILIRKLISHGMTCFYRNNTGSYNDQCSFLSAPQVTHSKTHSKTY